MKPAELIEAVNAAPDAGQQANGATNGDTAHAGISSATSVPKTQVNLEGKVIASTRKANVMHEESTLIHEQLPVRIEVPFV